MPNEPLLKKVAAARYLGITERQLTRLMDRRVITWRDFEGVAMFDKTELEAYLDRIRVEAQ